MAFDEELDTRMGSRRSRTVLSQGFLLAGNIPRNLIWTPRKQNGCPEICKFGSQKWVHVFGCSLLMFLIGGPENGSRLRPQKWVRGFTKKSKNVPRVNKLGPKRAPKVVSGEGEQHLGPEMGNNISWPEMGTIEWGETHLRRKPMSTPRATLAALRRGSKKHTFYGPTSGTEKLSFCCAKIV
jgi:hypothetical protein